MSKIEIARVTTLISFFGLLALVIYWTLNPAQLKDSATSFVLLLGGLPLLFGMSGILKKKPYTHAWICMIALLYLIHGVVGWNNQDIRLLASLEIALSVLLYLGAGFFARFRSRELKALNPDSD